MLDTKPKPSTEKVKSKEVIDLEIKRIQADIKTRKAITHGELNSIARANKLSPLNVEGVAFKNLLKHYVELEFSRLNGLLLNLPNLINRSKNIIRKVYHLNQKYAQSIRNSKGPHDLCIVINELEGALLESPVHVLGHRSFKEQLEIEILKNFNKEGFKGLEYDLALLKDCIFKSLTYSEAFSRTLHIYS